MSGGKPGPTGGEVILGMPLLDNIVQISSACPTEWMVRSVEGKIFHVKFAGGELIVRRDNRWSGKEIIRISFPSAKLCNYMSTPDMIAHTGFRMDHELVQPVEDEVQCG